MKKLCLLAFLLSCINLYAQTKQALLTGTVTDEQGEAIYYASVHLKNTTTGTFTNEKGAFSLQAPAGKATLVVTYLGYKVVEKNVTLGHGQTYRFKFQMQPETITLNEVMVMGKSNARKVSESAYNVVAIEAKRLYNSSLDMSHALDRISGVRIRENGGVGSGYSFSLNGFTGRQVKFFIDGVPMENFGSSFQINNIPINLAERLEIYKGVVPISLGSDALGGAVNIVTNARTGSYVDASYSYGSFNTHRSYVNAGYTSKSGFTAQINVFQNYSDNNYRVLTDIVNLETGQKTFNVRVPRFHDKYHNETLIAHVGVVGKPWADKLLFGITLGQNRADIQTGARMKEFVYGERFRKGNTIMPTLRYLKRNAFVKGLDINLMGNYNLGYEQTVDTVPRQYNWLEEYIEKTRPAGESALTLYKYRNHNGVLTSNVNYQLNKQHTLTLNNVLNTFNRKGKDEASPASEKYEQPRKTLKNVLGLGYKLNVNEQWDLSLFAKHFYQRTSYSLAQEGSTGWGSTHYVPTHKNHTAWGYGFASTYFVAKDLQLKLSYEKSLRMPGNEELFGNDGESLEGNMVLKPESSHNINLGWGWNTLLGGKHGLIVDGSFIFRDARDFIRPKLNTNGTHIVMENQDKVKSLGVNAEVRYSYKQLLTVGANMTYQDMRNNTKYITYSDGQRKPSNIYRDRMPNTPYLFGNADASVFIDHLLGRGNRLTIGYNLLYVHEYYLRWPSEGSKKTKYVIPTQLSHDVNLVYSLKDGRYNVALECRNILNEDLYDNFSLQKPGRSFTLKLRYYFAKY